MSDEHHGGISAVYRAVRTLLPTAGISTPVAAETLVIWRGHGRGREVFLVRHSGGGPAAGLVGFPSLVMSSDDGEARRRIAEIAPGTDIGKPIAHANWGAPWSPAVRASLYLAEAEQRQPPAAWPDVYEGGCFWSVAEIRRRWTTGQELLLPGHAEILAALEGGAEPADALRTGAESDGPWSPIAGLSVLPLPSPTLPPASDTNCIVVGSGELAVVDPAATSEEAQQRLLSELRRRLRAGAAVPWVLLTHHHGDHIGAAKLVAEEFSAVIAAHSATWERLAGRIPVGRALEDGDVIDLAGTPPRRLRALWTPGHAPGHLCFVEEESQLVIAGDMVAGIGTILIEPQDGDMAEYLRSLERLRSLGARALIPAHGPLLTDADGVLDHYREHRLARERAILAALGRGLSSTSDIVGDVYRDVPTAVHALAALSVRAHLAKLAAEGSAVCHKGAWSVVGSD